MFAHQAIFTDGPCQGRRSTIPSDDPEPPLVLFVASDIRPRNEFTRSRYCRTTDGTYAFDGSL